MLKKFFTKIIFCAALIFSVTAQAAGPILYSDSVIVIETSTGRVVYEKNSDAIYPPASMTKMLTCILGIQYLRPETEVKISAQAAAAEYSDLHLNAGDILTAHELLLGTMLVSDNGGAIAVAQAVAGNVPDFVNMMNDKLVALGCKNSHFANPNGLPDPDHLSTARDISKIANYCMKFPEFREIVATDRAIIHWIEPKNRTVEAINTNELLETYEGINGIKTGYTLTAGGCLTASAKRGDVELIAVIMHSKDLHTRFIDAKELLDYGFDCVEKIYKHDKNKIEQVVFVRGGKKGAIHVGAEEDLNFPLLIGEDEKNFSVVYDVPKVIDAGIKSGETVGHAILNYDGEEVARVPLVAKDTVAKGFSFGSTFVKLTEPLISHAENFYKMLLA